MANISAIIERQPELSFVPPQNFFVIFDKIPQIVFNCQQVQIPTVSAGEVALNNRFNGTNTFIPGDSFDYSNLDITFLLEKNFRNYNTVLKWMKAAATPESASQFTEWVEEQSNDYSRQGYGTLMSDCTVYGTDAANDILVEWKFKNAFPVSLDGPAFDASAQDIEYLTSTVSIRYSYFTTTTYTNGAVNNDTI